VRAALQKAESFKIELKQWADVAAKYESGKSAGAAACAGDEGGNEGDMDPELLARFSSIEGLESDVLAAVEDAALNVSKLTELVRSGKHRLRRSKAGAAAASTLLRGGLFLDGSAPQPKALLKAIASAPAAASSTSSSSALKPAVSASKRPQTPRGS
jgi:hypothetical protein